jgi:hypothetical protein
VKNATKLKALLLNKFARVMKNIILFDIDHTLLDTEKLRPYFPQDYSKWADASLPFKSCIYPEVVPVLDMLATRFTLGIFSISTVDKLQSAKLEEGGIMEYFDTKLVFINNSLDGLINDIAQVSTDVRYIIDDRLDKLRKAHERYPSIRTVHIKRGKYAKLKSGYIPKFTFLDLTQLPHKLHTKP